MRINEFDYKFNIRPAKDVALTLGVIYNDLGYKKINKKNILDIFNLTDEDFKDTFYITAITEKVDKLNIKNKSSLENMCNNLQQKWNSYKAKYFNIIKNFFNIEIDSEQTYFSYCHLHYLPINEIDLQQNIIYLDCQNGEDEVFKNFIILLTKAILINKLSSLNNFDFNKDFELKNKVWLFAELAVDAIFNNSDLYKISTRPTYKYFYSLKVKEINAMNYLRELYKHNSLDDFLTETYFFVHNNYLKLMQFRNYLY